MFIEKLNIPAQSLRDFTANIERTMSVRDEARVLRGRADNLFGNIIIEFEKEISLGDKVKGKRVEAEEQLRRYAAILWSHEQPGERTPYLGLATDGVRFITYTPVLTDETAKVVRPEMVELRILEQVDWAKQEPQDVLYWLDRYFLRQEVMRPTSEAIVADFGFVSHAFQTATHDLLSLWKRIHTKSAFAVVFESWEKYLLIVYGSDVVGDELFIRHTYLATLAKIMAWKRIAGATTLPDDVQIVDLLEGDLFKRQGIENFIEEDFFSWVARGEAQKVAVNIVKRLFSLLQNYDLGKLSEDVLKSLYQELVDPETRHDLGEYYTPDWLAHRIVRQLLDANPQGRMLDPSCGSGTFLYLAIREKRERLGETADTLAHILGAVYGSDIHPLAVIVAKTNYLLALGDLVRTRRGTITIPVYLADTLRLPEWRREPRLDGPDLPSYRVELDGQDVFLPDALLKDVPRYDTAIELVREFAARNLHKPVTLDGFRNFLLVQRFATDDTPGLDRALFAVAETLKHFMDIDRDSIWAFVLKNTYKPLFFRGTFDFIVGNPPWLSFRYTDPAYQKFLKRQIVEEYGLLKGKGNLITQMEVATLFLVRAADLYLKRGGTIAFVLPRSLFSADQHDGLRRRDFTLAGDPGVGLFWHELWDCQKVSPLFSVPTCVVFGEKRVIPAGKRADEPPVPGRVLAGKLPRKNTALAEAAAALTETDVAFSLHTRGKRTYWDTAESFQTGEASYYKKHFAQGATIVPRSFWFVQVPPSPFGFNPGSPPLETDARAIKEAKAPYKNVRMTGNVESRFLYATLLSTDLLPFGYLAPRLVVLPLEVQGGKYRTVDAAEAQKRGYYGLAQWLNHVEADWVQLRSATSANITSVGWLDYHGKLTAQDPQARYRVVFNRAGTYLTGAVVEDKRIAFSIHQQEIEATHFAVDYLLHYMETANRDEAYFLAALLNAPVIDQLIKPMQSQGLFGPRDIGNKVFELPIPRYDAENGDHARLV